MSQELVMYHVTAEYAQNNFAQLLDRALTEPEGIVIVKDNQSLILISQAELESWRETTELLKDPNLLSDVQASRQDYAQGEVVTMAQVF